MTIVMAREETGWDSSIVSRKKSVKKALHKLFFLIPLNKKKKIKKASSSVKSLRESREGKTLKKIMKNTWFPANLDLCIQEILAKDIN